MHSTVADVRHEKRITLGQEDVGDSTLELAWPLARRTDRADVLTLGSELAHFTSLPVHDEDVSNPVEGEGADLPELIARITTELANPKIGFDQPLFTLSPDAWAPARDDRNAGTIRDGSSPGASRCGSVTRDRTAHDQAESSCSEICPHEFLATPRPNVIESA